MGIMIDAYGEMYSSGSSGRALGDKSGRTAALEALVCDMLDFMPCPSILCNDGCGGCAKHDGTECEFAKRGRELAGWEGR